MRPARAAGALFALLCGVAGCGEDRPPAAPGAAPPTDDGTLARASRPVPASMASCAQCHARIVEDFLGHAMSDSLGPADAPPSGTLRQPKTGATYAFVRENGRTELHARGADGALRRQLVVGRIGAGRVDTSWVTTELDPDGAPTGHLFFAPVESMVGHGLVLSPFEQSAHPVGLDQPVTARCLGCHTNADVEASVAARPADGPAWPRHRLGAELFTTLPALDCASCHGDARGHAARMLDPRAAPDEPVGLPRLSELPAPRQRDVCARCHLEGDGFLPLAPLPPSGPIDGELPALRPTLVPARPGEDFRFVGQVERLALSACQQRSGQLTCTSCHAPHRSVAAQGVESFDAACRRCHADGADCARPPDLSVLAASGRPARSPDGCVDCHVRRSQPFDIPGLVSADHWVRRRIAPPATAPARHVADPGGPLTVFDDGRLREAFATDAGRRWVEALAALGLAKQQRWDEAAATLDGFPPPGSDAARAPTSPAGLPPLERWPEFHFVRGSVLQTLGRAAEAEAAYGDALALDPRHPEARLDRAALALERGELRGALADAELLLTLWPGSEKPWNLRAIAAARGGELPAAAGALSQSVLAWPGDAAVWHELGRMALRLSAGPAARAALAQAARLAPSREGLAADLAAAERL